jgi:hypothetical protein
MTCLAIVEGQTRRKNGLTLFDRTLYRRESLACCVRPATTEIIVVFKLEIL